MKNILKSVERFVKIRIWRAFWYKSIFMNSLNIYVFFNLQSLDGNTDREQPRSCGSMWIARINFFRSIFVSPWFFFRSLSLSFGRYVFTFLLFLNRNNWNMLRPGAPKHLKTWWGQGIKSMKLREIFWVNGFRKVGKFKSKNVNTMWGH